MPLNSGEQKVTVYVDADCCVSPRPQEGYAPVELAIPEAWERREYDDGEIQWVNFGAVPAQALQAYHLHKFARHGQPGFRFLEDDDE